MSVRAASLPTIAAEIVQDLPSALGVSTAIAEPLRGIGIDVQEV